MDVNHDGVISRADYEIDITKWEQILTDLNEISQTVGGPIGGSIPFYNNLEIEEDPLKNDSVTLDREEFDSDYPSSETEMDSPAMLIVHADDKIEKGCVPDKYGVTSKKGPTNCLPQYQLRSEL